MKIYDESLENIIESPDLEKGYLVDDKIITVHHEEQKQQIDYEIMKGTVTEENPNGLRRMIEVVPYRAAYDEYEDVKKYILYTEEELAQKAKEKEEADATEAARIEAEKQAAEQAKIAAKEQAAREQKIAKIDELEAQILYTAMMTDTLVSAETEV